MQDRLVQTKPRNNRGRKHFGAQHSGKRCSFPWINSQIIQASDNGDLNHLLGTVIAHLPHMNLVNLSTAVHRLAKLTANDPKSQADLRQNPALKELLQAILAAFGCLGIDEAQPQSLSNVVWSLATMRLLDKVLIQKVAALAVANISIFKPFELSTMLWAFAKLGTIDNVSSCTKPVFHAAATHMMKHLHTFGFRCLATTAWAFATARQHHARLFRSIAAQMLPMVHAANCQEMANTAWAFGTANFHDDQLFAELADKALLHLEEFKPQELSNMLWGFASNGFFHEAFFASSSIIAQRMDLQAQHLANILWAFARVQPRHSVTKATILALLPWCTLQLDTFKPQEVSATVLAVAKAFGRNSDLEPRTTCHAFLERRGQSLLPNEVLHFFAAVVPWATPRMREFSAQSLANTISAYAMVQVIGAEALFTAIGNEVLKRYTTLDATMLLHLLKGFAAVPSEGFSGGAGVLQALASGVAGHITEFRPQELQALSRICTGLLGLRRSRDLTCEELRSCLFSLAVGEATIAMQPVSPPPVEAHDLLTSGNVGLQSFLLPHGPAYGSEIDALEGSVYEPGEGGVAWAAERVVDRGRGGARIEQLVIPVARSLHALPPAPAGPPRHQEGYSQGNAEGSRVPHDVFAGHYNEAVLGDVGMAKVRSARMPAAATGPMRPRVAWHSEDVGGHVPLCTISELDRLVLGQAPLFGAGCLAPEGVTHVKDLEAALHSPVLDDQAVRRGGGMQRPRLPSGAPGHTDFQWRCSVKNSFLHVEAGNESDDGADGPDSWDGGSSQRSNSVPSRLEYDEPVEEWHRRHPDKSQGYEWSRLHADFENLDFEWGRGRRPVTCERSGQACRERRRGRAPSAERPPVGRAPPGDLLPQPLLCV